MFRSTVPYRNRAPFLSLQHYMGTLYLVATPIGNLEDITHRAIRVLGEVPLIAAEDTRQTRKLLSHFEIKLAGQLISYHDHSQDIQLDKVLSALETGDVALVSDAGMPGINDPGYALVSAALDAGHTVSPIPGPSAPLAALTASGLPSDSFLYLGYLPRKTTQRVDFLQSVKSQPYTLIFFETPHRLQSSLDDLRSVLGNRMICVAREMTKMHEEFFRGMISEASEHFTDKPARGEITLIVAGAEKNADNWSAERLREAINVALAEGEKPSTAARNLAEESGWSRREVYALIMERKE